MVNQEANLSLSSSIKRVALEALRQIPWRVVRLEQLIDSVHAQALVHVGSHRLLVANDHARLLVFVGLLFLAADFQGHKQINHARPGVTDPLDAFGLTDQDALVTADELNLLDGIVYSLFHLILLVDLSDVLEVRFLPINFAAIIQVADINVGTSHDNTPVIAITLFRYDKLETPHLVILVLRLHALIDCCLLREPVHKPGSKPGQQRAVCLGRKLKHSPLVEDKLHLSSMARDCQHFEARSLSTSQEEGQSLILVAHGLLSDGLDTSYRVV